MSPKSIAFLVVGMLVISSVFFIFHVTYPDNPATIKINPPKTPKNVTPPNLQIFQNQTLNLPHLGLNQTSFTPSGNTTLTLSGYVYNSSNHQQVLSNQRLGIAVMQAITFVNTNSQGYYQVQIKASGQGTFAFKVFQYATGLYDLYISPGMKSLTQNIYLSPLQKYAVSGVTESHGNNIGGVDLSFHSFWGTYSSVSSSSGSYSVNMVDENYTITAQKTGFSPIPNPNGIDVSNAPQSPFNIQLNSSNQAILYMSGYVQNSIGQPVSGATVQVVTPQLANSSATTFANGFYNISVAYYSNTIQVSGTGYTSLSQTLIITHNLTNENFTLTSFNPFVQGQNTGIVTPGPAGMNDNSAAVNYGAKTFPTIQGTVYNNQTAMPVPNQAFTIYTSVNGSYFYYDMQSGSGGQYNIDMAYQGNFNYTVLSSKFNPTWLDQNLQNSVSNIFIWVTTSSSNIYFINGSLLNKITNGSLANATINVTGQGGQVLKTIHVSPNGSYNFTLLGGNYNLNISSPGFNSTSTPLNVNQNYSNMNFTLTPTTGISPGSSQWSPSNGTGLPGVNSTGIQSQFNASQNASGQSPTTTSGNPVYLQLQFNNLTGNPLSNTSYMMFIKVNGLYLKVNGTTDSAGSSVLPLAYGGTYILLPEMIDYSGSAKFVNTSLTNTVVFNMTELPLYTLQLNLSNPLSYTGAGVALSGLSGGGNYALPVTYQSAYEGSNFTLVNYSLPNGTYSFNYTNPSYVPDSFSGTISGQSALVSQVLKPYVLILDWSSATAWSYYVNSSSSVNVVNSGPLGSGSGTIMNGLTAGTFSFQGMIGSIPANSTSFTLSTGSNEKVVTFAIQQYTMNLSAYLNQPIFLYTNGSSNDSAVYNYTLAKFPVNIYISQFELNISSLKEANVTINSVLVGGSFSSGIYSLSNYFVSDSSTTTTISIAANGLTLQEISSMAEDTSMVYYEASLG